MKKLLDDLNTVFLRLSNHVQMLNQVVSDKDKLKELESQLISDIKEASDLAAKMLSKAFDQLIFEVKDNEVKVVNPSFPFKKFYKVIEKWSVFLKQLHSQKVVKEHMPGLITATKYIFEHKLRAVEWGVLKKTRKRFKNAFKVLKEAGIINYVQVANKATKFLFILAVLVTGTILFIQYAGPRIMKFFNKNEAKISTGMTTNDNDELSFAENMLESKNQISLIFDKIFKFFKKLYKAIARTYNKGIAMLTTMMVTLRLLYIGQHK